MWIWHIWTNRGSGTCSSHYAEATGMAHDKFCTQSGCNLCDHEGADGPIAKDDGSPISRGRESGTSGQRRYSPGPSCSCLFGDQ